MTDILIAPKDKTAEVVIGSPKLSKSQMQAINTTDEDLSLDVYAKMAKDPHVSACVAILKTAILEDSISFQPTEPDNTTAEQIAIECKAMFAALDIDPVDVLWDMLDAIVYGHRIAEIVYAPTRINGRLRTAISRIAPKPVGSLKFVVDPYLRVLGFVGQLGTTTPKTGPVNISDPALLDKEKCAYLSVRPMNGDPRGTSLLRPAYNPYYIKQQIWPEYLKYLVQFAVPSLVGTTSADATGRANDDGTYSEATAVLMEQLLAFRNASGIALPNGYTVEALWSSGDGAAFLQAFTMLDQHISKAITLQTLASNEAQFGTRAQSSVHQDILATLIRQMKRTVVGMIRKQILQPWVRDNYGDNALMLVPNVSLGEVEQEDISNVMAAIARLQASRYLDPSQLPALDAMLGLPIRTAEEVQQRQQPSDPTPTDPIVTAP